MPTLTYAQARARIQTGDTVGVYTGTLGSCIIQLGQYVAGLSDAHITHCGIALWVGERLMLVEMNAGGNVIRPLSQYAGRPMVVCEPPPGTDLSRFEVSGLDHVTARHIPYSAGDLVRIGLRLLTLRLVDNRNWGRDGPRNKVCSLLPAMLYAHLGGDVSGIPRLAAPAEVVQALCLRLRVGGA